MKEGFLTNSNATRKTTRFWVRDAKCSAANRHAPSQHGRTKTPNKMARNAKNPVKIKVLQHGLQKANGQDRNRTFTCFPNYLEEFERQGERLVTQE
jgi:hypothetical protein